MAWFAVSVTLVLTIVVCSQSASILQAASATCTQQGKTYQVGEKTDSACQPCTCTSGGQMACLVIDCFFPAPCVDAVHEKGKCCATCPNGQNCKHGNHIIKMGEVYKPDAHTSCQCSRQFFGPLAHTANCTKV